MKYILSTLFLMLMSTLTIVAQKKDKNEGIKLKFGDIKAEMFAQKHPLFDSTSNAIILTDIGKSHFEGNSDGWFTLIFKRHQRIKIVNKSGTDAANFSIPLYGVGADKEKLTDLKASAFNFQNGQVVESKLDDKQIFEDKVSKNWTITKFAVPQVKEGSIIEVVYEVRSKYLFNLQSWEFQDTEHPRVWSDYTVEIPDFFHYVVSSQGYLPFLHKTTENSFRQFSITEPGEFSTSSSQYLRIGSNVIIARWVVQDAPALKKEPFTRSYNNHISKLSFQLAAYRFPNQPEKQIMPNWKVAAEELLKREDFGEYLSNAKLFTAGTTREVVGDETDSLRKAHKIYNFIKEKIACTGNEGIYTKKPARVVLKDQKGSVAEMNLLLVVMLRLAGLDASPILISTRSHGLTSPYYPLMDKYNYVLCQLNISGNPVFLDATEPRLGFGKLEPQAYNGVGFVVSTSPANIAVTPDLVTETQFTSLLINQTDTAGWSGEVSSTFGPMSSYSIRNEIEKDGEDAYFKEIAEKFPTDIKLADFKVEALKNYEDGVRIKYNTDLNALKDADMIYFSPFVGIESVENPFKSNERNYPVEFPCKYNEVVNVSLGIPSGYVIEDMPKSARIKLENGDGFFEYLIENHDQIILIRTRLVINKTEFEPEEYEALRSFFTIMLDRQQRQIVFKKST